MKLSSSLSSVARRAVIRIAALRRHLSLLLEAGWGDSPILSDDQYTRAANWANAQLQKAERQLSHFASKVALLELHTPAYKDTSILSRDILVRCVSAKLCHAYGDILNPSFAQAWDARYSE